MSLCRYYAMHNNALWMVFGCLELTVFGIEFGGVTTIKK